MATTISFDQIAHAYDSLHAHPPEVAARIGAAIARATRAGALVLELGVGTGRIGLPAAAAGCRVAGVDISLEMLRVARTNGLHAVAQGDMLQLPIRDAAIDAVLAVHVFHLVSDWRGALAEAVRVLRPGGAIINGRDWRDPESCYGLLRAKLREVAMDLQPGIRPPGAGAALAQALARYGGVTDDELVAAEWEMRASPAQIIEDMAAGNEPETWALGEALLQAAIARVRAWAEATWSDLAAEQTVRRRFLLSVTRLPAR